MAISVGPMHVKKEKGERKTEENYIKTEKLLYILCLVILPLMLGPPAPSSVWNTWRPSWQPRPANPRSSADKVQTIMY